MGNITVAGKSYGERFSINGVQFSFHPAGHVPGSSQIRVENRGEVWVFTGDYKLENDGISTPFEAVPVTHLLPNAPLDSLSLTGKIL